MQRRQNNLLCLITTTIIITKDRTADRPDVQGEEVCVYVCVLRRVGGSRAGEGKMRNESHSTLLKVISCLLLCLPLLPPRFACVGDKNKSRQKSYLSLGLGLVSRY